MFIDRILFPVETLGPGNRLVIWTRGCSKHCIGCANPELWSTKNARNYSIEDIFKIIKNIYSKTPFDGITISGGDPLEQKEDLLALVEMVSDITDDILVYTGYELEELKEILSCDELEKLYSNVSVLIDGTYKEELNTPEIVLRGSSNQNIYFFKEKYKNIYSEYMKQGRLVQNIYMGERLVSIGIHNRNGV